MSDIHRHAHVAARVKSLIIRPAFLPSSEEADEPPSTMTKLLNTSWAFFKGKDMRKAMGALRNYANDDSFVILTLALNAFRQCRNLRKVKIILHDLAVTPAFVTFLMSLLESDAIGPQLEDLSIDATVFKMSPLLRALAETTNHLTSLATVNIHLAISRFSATTTNVEECIDSIHDFYMVVRNQMTDLVLSVDTPYNISKFFGNCPTLPKLQKVTIVCPFKESILTSMSPLSHFLRLHSSTLLDLTIVPYSLHPTIHHPTGIYSSWLRPERDLSLFKLSFPALRKLDFTLLDSDSATWPHTKKLSLGSLAPCLTELAIKNACLSDSGLNIIVDGLPKVDGVRTLTSLSVFMHGPTPLIFDNLSRRLPRLKSLTIQVSGTFFYTPEVRMHLDHQTQPGSLALNSPQHIVSFSSRRYTDWGLRYLRITRSRYDCGIPHPCIVDMEIVAKAFSSDLVLDKQYPCYCLR